MKLKKELSIIIGILVAFGALVLIESNLPNFARFFPVWENKLLVVVLNINLLLILLLLFLITRIILKAYIEKKRGIWGSGLKKRLTSTLLFISIVPSFTLFVLATGFFYVSMDRWFSQQVEDTMESALELSRLHYEGVFQRHTRIGEQMVEEIGKKDLLQDEKGLRKLLRQYERTHLLGFVAVYDPLSAAIVRAGGSAKSERTILSKLKLFTGKEVSQEIIPDEGGEMLVVGMRLTPPAAEGSAPILFLGDTIKIQGKERMRQIAVTSKEFRESRVFKKVLKYSFIIPLFLITILTIFVSLWVGIKMATEITVPIEKMKEGAAIIAKGKFDINLEDRGKDEIGTLVRAFNSMAKELKIAKDEIESKSRSLEFVLNNVAAGIISTDKRGNILLANNAARVILGVEREKLEGMSLREVFGNDFKALTKSFLREVRSSKGESITKDLRLSVKKDFTYLRASLTALKDERSRVGGFIIAFDDITHVVRAEKLATWQEVARKLTHEIKNPLTPIVLSAERIRRKLMAKFAGTDKDVLDETTSVIIRSVADIKDIVNELTKLTHTSQARTLENLNGVVDETLDLYRNLYHNISIGFEPGEVPLVRVDRDGLKRAFINLITNAVKAIDGEAGTITVRTRYDRAKRTGIIEFADTGKGVPDEDKEKVFDPYFTKDEGGTGLGLAIVHSIILEHHGRIRVEDNSPKGAKFIIEIPITET
ncbi:MAG: Sensor protein kinase WalK [Syntrophorhabdus sp. PtaB.Bin047]|jgi:two-component system nitrogen regulation sensor histidine kinase NtrY|nr:MAG: Sensor protein kinase WalK [Syntrophorhabdus sp. PtaB.Bin047]